MTASITVVDTRSVTMRIQNGQTDITGTPTPGSAATSIPFAADTVSVVISGTWTGTLQFEETVDGINFVAVDAVLSGTNTISQTCTGNGTYNVAKSANGSVRVRAVASMTGSAVIAFTDSGLLTPIPVVATGQVIIAVTGTAVQLPSNALLNGVIVTANGNNAASVVIGNSSVANTLNGSGNGQELAPGASTSFAVTNLNQLWVNGAAGDWISFGGS